MLHRRSTATTAPLLALLALLVGVLSACGFDYPTDRVNTIGAGVNDREGQVDLLGIRILAEADGQGRLIGALVNNEPEAASLDAVTDDTGAVTAEFSPVEVGPEGHVNLATEVEIPVTGEFAAGDFVPLTFELSTGETATLDVPVVKRCYQYTAVPEPSGAAESESPVADDETGSAEEEAGEELGEDAGTNYECAEGYAELGGEH